jgi:uncharacterized protein YciI
MLFVIIGHDGPNGAALRPTVRPRHLAYVGPVAKSGFANNDPYARGGVFGRVEVKPCRKVLPE